MTSGELRPLKTRIPDPEQTHCGSGPDRIPEHAKRVWIKRDSGIRTWSRHPSQTHCARSVQDPGRKYQVSQTRSAGSVWIRSTPFAGSNFDLKCQIYFAFSETFFRVSKGSPGVQTIGMPKFLGMNLLTIKKKKIKLESTVSTQLGLTPWFDQTESGIKTGETWYRSWNRAW